MFFAVVAIVAATPTPDAKADAKPEAKPLIVAAAAPVAYTAPLVTATSSQTFVRNYNGLAGVSAPLIASPYAAYNAYTSPYVAYPSAAYATAPYFASPYTSAIPVVV